ncbi:hypothetical protein D9758_015683 [Tetrapyrgos nigripes]|uniref:F-box domain-containing protein n=1 Tax=Tetrapyrgos nigripes TaxID=182062 RepID=A0A8H5C850_9AGAR|nr:hypothetical protein D9758_015683 [Tetrapyrgos nigripes]
MSAFLELPTEILYAIVLELVNGYNRKSLRCTCKGLSAVVEPILFSEIVLKTDSSALVRWSIPFCEALFEKDQRARALATYVRTLKVDSKVEYSSLFRKDDANQKLEILDAWRVIFPTALSKLVSLQSFRRVFFTGCWKMSRTGWIDDQVFEVISKLPSLFEFILAGEHLEVGYPGALRLDYLHNLRTLLIDARQFPDDGFEENIFRPLATAITNSPDLQTLQILTPYSRSKPLSFIDLFKSVLDTKRTPALKIKNLTVENLTMDVPALIIPHLQCLSSLDLRAGHTDVGNFWNALGTANVSLESLIVVCHNTDRTLLDYISHFPSTLQVLQLASTAATFRESDELADLFFDSVLPIFAESLRELSIRPSHEGRWCIGLHGNLATLSSCTNLESLFVCLNGDKIVDVVGDVVSRAHSLPRLKSLYLGTTFSHSNGMDYHKRMWKTLRETVENLQPTEAHIGTGLRILPFYSFTEIWRTWEDGSLSYVVNRRIKVVKRR